MVWLGGLLGNSTVDATSLINFPENDNNVLMGDWITKGSEREVINYNSHTERLLLVWDDMTSDPVEPQVDVMPDPDDADIMHVMMNNKCVAEVYGDPQMTTADITMIPLSSALIVGFEPA